MPYIRLRLRQGDVLFPSVPPWTIHREFANAIEHVREAHAALLEEPSYGCFAGRSVVVHADHDQRICRMFCRDLFEVAASEPR